MKSISRLLIPVGRILGAMAFALLIAAPNWNVCSGQESPKSGEVQDVEALAIAEKQKLLAERYKLLEEKLFSLYEFERDSNPMRSKLLERAYIQSQEKMTSTQLNSIVAMIEKGSFRDAQPGQERVLADLKLMLQLLESEDRGKRVRDEIQRHQEYLKEVERILRIQKGIRGQTEGGSDTERMANSQKSAADRTEKLADDLKQNEEDGQQNGDENNGEPNDGAKSGDQKSSDENSDSKSGEADGGSKKDSNSDADNKNSENKSGDPNQDKNGEDKNDPENSDQKPKQDPKSGESKSGDPKPGENPDGSPPSGQPVQSGEPGESGEQGDPPKGQQQAEQDNPVRKRIEAAEKRMRDAQQKLEKARRADSVEDMKAAEREMALAKKELEEILRQLREEEIERTLAMLEGRFRKMLEREIRVYESTRKLDRTAPDERGTDFEIKAGKLAAEQSSIATEAARALMLLREDGSSVAFPETVEQMHEDMLQVAARLSAAKVGRITIQIEEDIIDTLDYLIEALVKTQQDMEAMKQQQQQQQQQGQPGDKPLVDQLAEIKMLRGLQERIYRRHKRYSQLLDDPDDPVGTANDSDLQNALERLSEKQKQLADIARDIALGKNK